MNSKLSLRQKAGSIVLTGTLLAGVLVAAISAGYHATKVDLSNATADLPRGNTVVTVNGETQRVEAEARALATGKDELEPVTLQDGRVAVVNHRTKTVELLPLGLAGQGPQIDRSRPAAGQEPPDTSELTVVQAKDAPYLIDPAKDIAESIDLRGQPQDPVVVPGGASADVVPDVTAGVWIRSDDHKAVHVVRGNTRVAVLPDQVEHLSLAEGRPIAVTSAGAALDIASDPVAAVTTQPLPHGLTVLVGSHRGAGRYLVLIDRKEGKLVVADPRTKSVLEFTDLPRGPEHNLGAPVMLDDRVYVPDYAKHRLYVRDLAGNARQEDVVVPGTSKFTVEVRDRRVWANDQYDRGAVTIGRDGRPSTVDKGSGPGLQSDTTPIAPPPGSTRTQAPPASGSSPAPPRTTPPTSAPARRQVTVPSFPQGTPQAEACGQIRALSLRCEPVETGSDGPFGTVRDTDPAGGSRVPEQSVVRVRVYGPIPVPDVVGKRRSVACRQLQPALRCDEQPMPGPAPNRDLSQLDIVARQNPAGGQRAERGAGVTVEYWTKTEMDNLVGKPGAAECTRIMTSTNNLVSCELVQGAEAPSPAQAGTITQQSVAAGAEVKINDRVVLTIYQAPIARVPGIPPGTPIEDACRSLPQQYRCIRVADASAPIAGVISQEPQGGTPQESGDVVLHYSPYASQALWLWRHTQFPDVHVIRLEGQTPAGYTQVKQLGRAYPPGTSPSFRHINGFTCVGTLTTCKGVSPNHYYTADTANPHGWQGPSPITDLPPATNGTCPAGQRAISRYGRLGGDNNRYTVDFQPVSGYNLIEVLGCVWLP